MNYMNPDLPSLTPGFKPQEWILELIDFQTLRPEVRKHLRREGCPVPLGSSCVGTVTDVGSLLGAAAECLPPGTFLSS